MKKILILLIFLLPITNASINISYFYVEGYEICQKIEPFINELENNESINLNRYNLNGNESLFDNTTSSYNYLLKYNNPTGAKAIPSIFVANGWFIFNESNMEEEKEKVKNFLNEIKDFEIENLIEDNGKLVYPKPVCILIAYNPSLHDVNEILNALEENISFTKIEKLDLSYEENRSIIKNLGNFDLSNPIIFIGNKSIIFEENIDEIISTAKYYEKAGIDFPYGYKEKKICVVLFYKSTCPICVNFKRSVELLGNFYPLEIKIYDLKEKKNEEILLNYYNFYRVEYPYDAIAFIGDKYFIKENLSDFENEIKKYLGSGIGYPSVEEGAIEGAENIIRGFTLLSVIVAGLLDGINPCAFATLVFFISYLERAKKKSILAIGLAFTAGIFICYFLIGIGLVEFFGFIESYTKRYINIAIGSAAIILGALSIYDFFAIKKGEEAKLQLPMFIKKRRGRLIKKVTEDRKVIILSFISFFTGFIVSGIELACTGQIYLPIAKVIQSASSLRSIALTYLFLYNLMFVLPLIIILSLFYFGQSSEKFGEAQKKSYLYVKILIGLFLIIIGLILLYSSF
jgi:cytochrome c biogenesis protein CcdA